MNLDFVEVCGFRGFRDRLRVEFGAGFTVITGRNGVGKSTLFDAVEYALTGTIDKYAVEKAAQESLSDYLWWRGAGKPDAHYVIASFKGDAGEVFTITRSRESGADKTAAQIEAALCRNTRPEDALQQLCRTSIIRDEWIAALSVDLSETERFEHVRGALGLAEGAAFAAKAKAVLKAAEAAHALRRGAYDVAREQLTRALTHVTEAKEAIARTGDVSAAVQILDSATPRTPDDLIGRLAAGRAVLSARRSRLGPMEEAVHRGREILAVRRDLESSQTVAAREQARVQLEAAMRNMDEHGRLAEEAHKALEREERTNDLAASLAALLDHGERLGLHDAHCPLCAAERTEVEFAAGLSLARQRVAASGADVSAARQKAAKAREAVGLASGELDRAQYVLKEVEGQFTRQADRVQAHLEFFKRHQLDARFAQDPDGLERSMNAERNYLIDLERALLTLEASQAVARTTSLEDQVMALRQAADVAASAVEASEAALSAAKAMDRGVRSISSEIVDERLAQISPLLNELYQRLRPHFDWRSIEYSIRGDLRRFLSLKVGDGLNPQFVFSSGQRRAAGLAFLLSIHLARSWTSWRTLLLDDPVQHIDDFRALHLIELLAALRLGGRQVVCAVEDEALADLLCRRLLSTSESNGRRYQLDIGPAGATSVVLEAEVPPMPTGVLRSRSEIRAVG